MPSGSRNSARSISPGCVGGLLVGTRTATSTTADRPPLPPVALPDRTRLFFVVRGADFLGRRMSVVIRDLDSCRSVRRPDVADPVLVVDPDRILALAIILELLPPVPGRGTQRFARDRRVQLIEFPASDGPQRRRARTARGLR